MEYRAWLSPGVTLLICFLEVQMVKWSSGTYLKERLYIKLTLMLDKSKELPLLRTILWQLTTSSSRVGLTIRFASGLSTVLRSKTLKTERRVERSPSLAKLLYLEISNLKLRMRVRLSSTELITLTINRLLPQLASTFRSGTTRDLHLFKLSSLGKLIP